MATGAVGVTALEELDAGPWPAELVAFTVNVYDVPFVRPVTVIGDDEPEAVIDPGDDVTVYEVIALPPFEAGAVNDTVACPLPAEADTDVGAPGTVGLEVIVTVTPPLTDVDTFKAASFAQA